MALIQAFKNSDLLGLDQIDSSHHIRLLYILYQTEGIVNCF